MVDNIKLQNQVEFLYHAAAKQLYNLALYTIGNQKVAEQITIDAFADAFYSITDKSDAELFESEASNRYTDTEEKCGERLSTISVVRCYRKQWKM